MNNERNVPQLIDALFTRVKKTTNEKVDICREYLKDIINDQQQKAACIVTLTPEAAELVGDFSKKLELTRDAAASMMIKLHHQEKLAKMKSNSNNTFNLDKTTMTHLEKLSAAQGLSPQEVICKIILEKSNQLDEILNNYKYENTNNTTTSVDIEETPVETINNNSDSTEGHDYINERYILDISEMDSTEHTKVYENPYISEVEPMETIDTSNTTDSNPYLIKKEDLFDNYSSLSKPELISTIIKCIKGEMSYEEIQVMLNMKTEYFYELMSEISNLSDEDIAKYSNISVEEYTSLESSTY